MKMSSAVSGFYKLSPSKRLAALKEVSGISDEDIASLSNAIGLGEADSFIENVVGVMGIPIGIATNFIVDGREILVPMAIEEPSVVAAASKAAKLARVKGGFFTEVDPPVMIGQIELRNVSDFEAAKRSIMAKKKAILAEVNEADPLLVSLGGGAVDIEVRKLSDDRAVVHLLVDVRDAMGANAVNTMCERVSAMVAAAAGAQLGLRILSNLADRRIARARAVFDVDSLGGERVVNEVIRAYEFASLDPYRAATHNKGAMNGIDALILATGNDWRAVEAGAHAHACRNGKYGPLTRWSMNEEGDLVGEIELPLPLGIVGGSTKVHPTARACINILGVKSAQELSGIAASLGLAQNFAALLALSTEGIQAGHMRLHERKKV